MKTYLTTTLSDGEFTWLKGEQNSSVNINSEMLETSDKSTKYRQYIPGMIGGTIDLTVFADNDSSSPQAKMLASLHKGEPVYVFVGILGDGETGPAEGDLAEAYVTSVGNTYDVNGVATRAVSLQITGEITHYPTIE